MTRLALRYHDWDEYFRTLSKATRKDLRRKFRKAERAAKIDMEIVSDITPYVDEIYPLYLEVHERSPLKFETLTKDYFRAIAQRMLERARFFIWRQSGKTVAFSFAWSVTIRFTMNASGWITALPLICTCIFTRSATSSWSLQQG
jgi:predicted N-acyltransferase